MRVYGFDERLAFSMGRRSETDLQTIKTMLPTCEQVEVADTAEDRRGVDYVATVRGGRRLAVDAKARERGCSYWWRAEPDLALEMWSDIGAQRPGWTYDGAKQTDLVFFTFDPSDTDLRYLISWPMLFVAFRKNARYWTRKYKKGIQNSVGANGREWRSQCVFVPASVVLQALTVASRTRN